MLAADFDSGGHLRKPIRLILLYPDNTIYQGFLDKLLTLYYDAKRIAADRRLRPRGRRKRVAELEDRITRVDLEQDFRDVGHLRGSPARIVDKGEPLEAVARFSRVVS